jgi:hypothetical protein
MREIFVLCISHRNHLITLCSNIEEMEITQIVAHEQTNNFQIPVDFMRLLSTFFINGKEISQRDSFAMETYEIGNQFHYFFVSSSLHSSSFFLSCHI